MDIKIKLFQTIFVLKKRYAKFIQNNKSFVEL
jgi:hypothetical protein